MSTDTVERLFHFARTLEHSERGPWLERECAGREQLRAEVEELLHAAEGGPGALDAPPLEHLARSARNGAATALIGARVGEFTLEELIAEGGMGVVYRARQAEPARVVALKLLRGALASPAAQSRFLHEAELLGRLSHPAIAQVYRCGLHRIGAVELPWLALEFVEGARALTEYARDERLSPEARVRLFLGVVDAVHHAHQRGVIHRDLKPSNLIVDRSGRVKVIDFGVARAIDAATTRSFATETGRLVGTLQYMSPEQCMVDPGAVDVRSDVYSLGLVAYELLCEREPYRVPDSSMAAAALVIQTETPLRPRRVRPDLDSDLETVLLAALRKDREQRYESAAAFARDLRRWLEGQPIQARPASAWYVLRKRAARNPLAAALIAALVIASCSFVAGLARLYARSEQARVLAGNEAREAEQANALLQQAILALMPSGGSEDRTAASLDDLGRRIASSVQPARQPPLWLALATVFEHRRDVSRANDAYARAGDCGVASVGRARMLSKLGRHAEAEAVAAAILGIVEPSHQYALRLVLLEARRAAQDFEQALLHNRAALELVERLEPAHAIGLLTHLRFDGDFHLAQMQLADAERAYRRGLALSATEPTWKHGFERALAVLELRRGHYREAAAAFEAMRAAPLLPDSIDLEWHLLCNRALCLGLAGDLPQALADFERGLAGKRAVLGERHRSVAYSLLDRGVVLERAGRLGEAEADARSALSMLEPSPLPEYDEYIGTARLLLGHIALARGEHDGAADELELAHEARARCLPKAHVLLDEVEAWAAMVEYARSAASEAQARCERALQRLEAVPDFDPHVAQRLRTELGWRIGARASGG
jgi:tetratricopeptide (TPR) repeat protein